MNWQGESHSRRGRFPVTTIPKAIAYSDTAQFTFMTNQQNRKALVAASLCFLPLMANAHPGHSTASGWDDGFMHPLQGADHILAMFLVGLWAAQQKGRAIWIIPMTFIGIMAIGGVAGTAGRSIPGVETAILVSVGVFLFLVARRIRPVTYLCALIVAFFAFFHGFAHGAEMPDRTRPISFGIGFLAATLLLHATGWVAWRAAVVSARRFNRSSDGLKSAIQFA